MNGITFSHVSKAYAGQQVLWDFSATFLPGEAAILMGPSGCGKTTLARLLLGLETPDSGAITGVRDARFSCVFQEDRLCPGFSAIENVALVLPRERRAGIPAALAAVGLTDADIHKPVAALSGGQKRRVALVRAVEAQSDVLVLDEAFKGLDEDNRARAFSYIQARLAGRTLLVITHDEAEAAVFGGRRVPLKCEN